MRLLGWCTLAMVAFSAAAVMDDEIGIPEISGLFDVKDTGATYKYVELPDESAVCLDGECGGVA